MSASCRNCPTAHDDDAKFCKNCGKKVEREATCNRCGLSCALGRDENCGLINQTVSGGYESTAGNGLGALDDCTRYTFSLCEFCLDWLFAQFKVPVKLDDYMSGGESEEWRPAAQRVAEDDWRKMKQEFQTEHDKRETARNTK